jgi:hypothetical protein
LSLALTFAFLFLQLSLQDTLVLIGSYGVVGKEELAMELARVAGEQFVCVDEKRAQVARDLKNSTFVQQAVRIRLVPLRSISTTSARADTVSAELNRPAATQYARVLCVSPTGQVFPNPPR